MATITYSDKVGLVTNPAADINKVTDADMNEIKTVVNTNATTITIIAWDMSTNVFPIGGKNGQVYYGTEFTTRTTLTDTNGDLLPSKVMATALQDNPTANTHFLFQYVI